MGSTILCSAEWGQNTPRLGGQFKLRLGGQFVRFFHQW